MIKQEGILPYCLLSQKTSLDRILRILSIVLMSAYTCTSVCSCFVLSLELDFSDLTHWFILSRKADLWGLLKAVSFISYGGEWFPLV